ncbi:MAG: hypothetical protein GX673_11695 [Gammaproteobacteria bacterium]|jgi:hypothetical protein|nr:hypothetical protein [Gammaproteobacteria bacterium]
MSNESLETFKKGYMKQFGLRNEQEYLDMLALIERQAMLNDSETMRQVYAMHIESIARNPDFTRLSFSISFSFGAPIVKDAEGIQYYGREHIVASSYTESIPIKYAVAEIDNVFSGKNIDGIRSYGYWGSKTETLTTVIGESRITGLKEAFRRKNAGGYRSELSNDHHMTGIPSEVIDAMNKPVLIRVVKPNLIPADVIDNYREEKTKEMICSPRQWAEEQRMFDHYKSTEKKSGDFLRKFGKILQGDKY